MKQPDWTDIRMACEMINKVIGGLSDEERELKFPRGNCYENALLFASENPEWTIVHGICIGRGKIKGETFGHAWVEYGDIVYDPCYNTTMGASRYYLTGQIGRMLRYSYYEALAFADEEGHSGPWDDYIRAVKHAGDLP